MTNKEVCQFIQYLHFYEQYKVTIGIPLDHRFLKNIQIVSKYVPSTSSTYYMRTVLVYIIYYIFVNCFKL